MYTDSHIHLFDLYTASHEVPVLTDSHRVCCSSHSEKEFAWNELYARSHPGQVVLSFGIHPQEPFFDSWPFLQTLVAQGRIHAIGECGFDAYDEVNCGRMQQQEDVWNTQIELAITASLPVLIHCRKGLPRIFKDAKKLAALPAVIFHGWSGSVVEANGFLQRGVNAFFSIGKALLREQRNVLLSVRDLPFNVLLSETDAPWMSSKGESYTTIQDIKKVVGRISEIKQMPCDCVIEQLSGNFTAAFGDSF